jgi:hypothetical protein
MFAPNPQRSLLETLLLGAVIVGVGALGAVVLYGATGWLWLIVHERLHDGAPLPAALVC